MKDDLFYIENILQSISRIQLYVSSKDYTTFVGDFIVQDAVVRQLEIIGEATKRITGKAGDLDHLMPKLLIHLWSVLNICNSADYTFKNLIGAKWSKLPAFAIRIIA